MEVLDEARTASAEGRLHYNIHAPLIHCTKAEIIRRGIELGVDYGLTHQIGERLNQEGHPGLLAPSARHAGGTTLVALTPTVLSSPRPFCYLTYSCDPIQRTVTVERQPDKILATLKF